MTPIDQVFLDESRRLLLSDHLPKIERCLERLSDEDLWWRPGEASNSIGNLLLHLAGNVNQWIVGGVGKRPYQRERQKEFDERTHLSGRELVSRLKAVVEEAAGVIGSVDAESLLSRRQIQGYDVTVLEAIYHVVEHFGMHTGQIIVLTKIRTGEDLKLWQPPK
jgi:uncharacterized damage-inducible protein DinB